MVKVIDPTLSAALSQLSVADRRIIEAAVKRGRYDAEARRILRMVRARLKRKAREKR